MREPQRNTKSPTPLNRYKPLLETLEDRSQPGNALIGLTGITMPFALSALSSLAASAAKASSTAAPAKSTVTTVGTSTSKLSITPSQLLASISGGKQTLPSTTVSSVLSQIQGISSSNTSSTNPGGSESWETILGRIVSAVNNASTSDASQPSVQKAGFVAAQSGSAASAATGALDGAGIAAVGTGSTGTTTTKTPPYDAATQARLHDYAEAGTQGYMQSYATQALGLSATQLTAAAALKAQFPNLMYQTNTQFGTPTLIMNGTGTLTGPQAGDPVTLARNYLAQIAPFLGVQQSDLNSLTVNNTYSETPGTSGAKVSYVYLQSTISGIPVYGATTSVILKGDGSIGLVNNGMYPNLQASINTTTPTISAAAAAAAAAQNLGLAVTAPIFQKTAGVGAQQKGTVSDGGFARQDINTELALVPTGLGSTRLAWHVTTYLKNNYLFEFYVDATDGNVLMRISQTHFDSYKVLPVTARAPNQGTISVVTNPADKLASPWGWHDTNGKTGAEYTITSGNNAAVRTRRDETAPGSLGYFIPSGGPTNTYNFSANFSKDPSTYQAAAAVQLFYAVNTWHDVSYHYGFTEVAGNMQQNNYGRGGTTAGANDAVQGFAQDDADIGSTDNAFMATPQDGFKPEVHMFVWDLSSPQRDGDFEADVVFHELGHGINHRLVNGGGPLGSILSGPQAGALDEGSADFDGLFFSNGLTTSFTKATPSATWVLGEPINGQGIRRFPYSTNKDINPLTYNDFDPSQVDVNFPPNPPFNPELGPVDESHNGGEIWTNTMWEMESNLVAKYGFSSNLATGTGGNNRAYQLYIAGLKMTPAFPSMLDARDAIIAADNIIYGGADLPEIWAAFADRGFGVHANAGVFDLTANDPGWQSSGIIEDFTVPDGLNSTPPPPPVGGDGSNDFLFEPNETSNAAFDLGAVTGVNTVTNLQIKQNAAGKAADRDWFKFTPTKAGVLTLNETPNTSAGDLDMRLYRSVNGSPTSLTEIGVGQGTHRSAGTPETITVAVAAGTTYFFNVQGFNGGLGNYNLTLTAPV